MGSKARGEVSAKQPVAPSTSYMYRCLKQQVQYLKVNGHIFNSWGESVANSNGLSVGRLERGSHAPPVSDRCQPSALKKPQDFLKVLEFTGRVHGRQSISCLRLFLSSFKQTKPPSDSSIRAFKGQELGELLKLKI